MLADLTPLWTEISQIPILTAHISFLLWELIFADQVLADLPNHQMAIIDSYSESSYLADQVLADLSHHQMAMIHSYSESSYLTDQMLADLPSLEWQFHRLLLWQLIFHSYSQNSYLAHQVLADLVPTSNGNCRFLLWELIFGRPSVGRCTPLFNADFTDSCFDHSYSIPNLRTHIWQTRCWQIYPTIKWQLKIPTLRAHIWQTRCWQIYPPLNGIFTDCCSDSSYFIPTLRTHIWHTSGWQI